MISLFRKFAGQVNPHLAKKPEIICTLAEPGDILECVGNCICADPGDKFTVTRNPFNGGRELYVHCDFGMHTLIDAELDEKNPKRKFKKL